ncbi:hypothetical protein Tco_1037545 [Tanacetum coccineum]
MAKSSSQILQQQDPHDYRNPILLLCLITQVGCCLRETFTRSPNQYKEYLSEFWYEEAVEAKGTLKKSLLPPRVNIDFARLIWEDLITKLNKKTREKVFPYPRFLSLLLEHNMEGYRYENVTLNPTQSCQWNIKLPIPLPTLGRRIPKAKSLELKYGHKKQPTSSKHHPLSKIETTKVAGLHKEDQQATGGPTSLGFTSKGGANPQLSSVGADSGIFALKDSISQTTEQTKSACEGLEIVLTQPTTWKGANNITQKIKEEFNTSPDLSSSVDTQKDIKLEDLSKMVQDVDFDFMDLDSPKDDEPIIIQDESNEEVHAEKSQNQKLEKLKSQAEAEVAFLIVQPSFSNVEQLTKLLVKSLKPEMSTLLISHDFSKSLPTKLKELPSKFNDLSGEIK